MAKGDGYADADKALAYVARRDRVIKARALGKTSQEIADEEGIHPSSVDTLVREAAAEVRAKTNDFVEERFAMHDARYEYLYKIVQKKLDDASLADLHAFAGLVRAAISVLERQSKLWGLDRAKPDGGKGRNWLDDASPAQLVKMAGEMGLTLPDKFVKGANNGGS